LGLLWVQVVVITGLALILVSIFWLYGIQLTLQFFLSLHGIFLEALVLLAVTMFFGMFATPLMVVTFSIGVFLIGHWLNSLKYFASKDQGSSYKLLSAILDWIVPNLELFNWRSAVIYGDEISGVVLVQATAVAIGWFLVLLTLSSVIFRRRDFA
jgi:hypothetical protein